MAFLAGAIGLVSNMIQSRSTAAAAAAQAASMQQMAAQAQAGAQASAGLAQQSMKDQQVNLQQDGVMGNVIADNTRKMREAQGLLILNEQSDGLRITIQQVSNSLTKNAIDLAKSG